MVSLGVSPGLIKASKYRIIGLLGRTISPASGAIYTKKSFLNPDFIDISRALRNLGFCIFPLYFPSVYFCIIYFSGSL